MSVNTTPAADRNGTHVPAPADDTPDTALKGKAKKADPRAEFAEFARANASKPKVKMSRTASDGGKITVTAVGHGYTADAIRKTVATAGVKYSVGVPDVVDGFDKNASSGEFAPAVAAAGVKMLGKL